MISLYQHQEVAKRFIHEKKWVLIGDEMGLGKSLEAIAALVNVKGPKVIVVPAMLRHTWKSEILKWFPTETVEVVSTGKHVYKTADWYITSYGLVKHCEVIPKAVIIDECHYIKNVKAKRTLSVAEFVLSNKPEYLVALSGTPIKNNATEFYSILKLLSQCPSNTNGSKVTEKSQYAFNMRFSRPVTQTIHGPNGPIDITKFEGIRNLERLKGYLKGKYLRRLTKSVIDLPPLIDKDILLEKRTKAKELKKAYEASEEGDKSEHIMTVKAENALSKAKDTAEYVSDLVEQGEAVVVFTDHIKPCEEITDHLAGKKIKVGMIDGGTPSKKRSDLVEQFQGEVLDVLVCTIGAASTGFTLTRARNLVFNDYSWGAVDMAQAKKRIHRIGQDEKCVIHYMLSSDVDKWIKQKVLDKEKMLGRVL